MNRQPVWILLTLATLRSATPYSRRAEALDESVPIAAHKLGECFPKRRLVFTSGWGKLVGDGLGTSSTAPGPEGPRLKFPRFQACMLSHERTWVNFRSCNGK